MRVVVQRVKSAAVSRMSGKTPQIIGEIKKGVVVFLGIRKGDTAADAQYLAEKLSNLRCFDDEKAKMNLSIGDIKGEIMVIPEFTLYADCRKGRRPDFTMAAAPDCAKELYLLFLDIIRKTGLDVASGEFRAEMLVEINNDGPVTFIIDSKQDHN